MNSILIVDDESNNLEALVRVLRTDFQIETTQSAFEALKKIQSDSFSVIVSDQRMPEMSGVDLLEKARTVCPHTSRILLTGYTDFEAVIDAVNRGQIHHYIAKPWDNANLKLTLRQAAEACELRKELEQKNQALEQSLKEIQTLDQAKDRFLALVSHELNTPLTILKSYLDLLSGEKKSLSSDAKKAFEAMQNATHRFEAMIQEVITYVKLEAKEVGWKREPVDLAELIEKMKQDLKSELGDRKLVLKTKKKMIVIGDPEKLTLAMNRLLKDVIQRAPSVSEITLELTQHKDQIGYRLSRKGASLPKSAFKLLDAKKIEHHQTDPNNPLGMGLALAKLIIEGHGGRLELIDGTQLGVWFSPVHP